MPILQNIVTGSGYVYCHLNRRAAKLAALPCDECPYFWGNLQGTGRECRIGEDDEIISITDPYEAEARLEGESK